MKANAFVVSRGAAVFNCGSFVSAPVVRRPPPSPSRGMRPPKDCMLPDTEAECIFHLFPFDRGQDQIFLVVIWSTELSPCHPVSTGSCANIRHQNGKNRQRGRRFVGPKFWRRHDRCRFDDLMFRVTKW